MLMFAKEICKLNFKCEKCKKNTVTGLYPVIIFLKITLYRYFIFAVSSDMSLFYVISDFFPL